MEGILQPPQANIHISSAPGTEDGVEKGPKEKLTGDGVNTGRGRNIVYQVRSSQAPKGRFKDVTTSSAVVYTVRLEAWNCSCAAFAFAAFPSGMDTRTWIRNCEEDDLEIGWKEQEREWEFGGLSADGKDGGSVPVCKHLLACLLAERWESVLGSYLHETEVGRDEMAGFGGEG